MRTIPYLVVYLVLASCSPKAAVTTAAVTDFREFKVLDSKYLTRDRVFKDIDVDLVRASTSEKYNSLILEKSIPELQQAIYDGKLTYEDLTIFYLNRIYKYDRNNDLSLNAVVALNPQAIQEARDADAALASMKTKMQDFNPFTIKGMPILLKDNINAAGMPTTAGAAVLMDNNASDATLVTSLKQNGAIILGKTNLSEWAYFFCGDCPSGYSAVGGQTLNPYGRRAIDTGGSSSGSGVAVAANFAVAAIGSETSGSILSPSSQNSVVGLKPTRGMISGKGVVPISSYLDTAGPMTKNVIDNAIVMDALQNKNLSFKAYARKASFNNVRLGVYASYKENALYTQALKDLENAGAVLVLMDSVARPDLTGFRSLLNIDMRDDLPAYFNTDAAPAFKGWDVPSVMEWNEKDAASSMPYGQALFKGIVAEKSYSKDEAQALKSRLTGSAQAHFTQLMDTYNIAGVISINNYNAGEAAVAFYPAITVPMGYNDQGQPFGLTFIAPSGNEQSLYMWATGYEQVAKMRKLPANYTN